MLELFANGRVVDLILGLIVVEAIVLFAYRRTTGKGIALGDLVCNSLSGVFLLLALRSALVGVGWPLIALCLLAALLMHLADVWRRWER